MVAHYAMPAFPPSLAGSRVSHDIEMSPQEKARFRLIFFALSLASFTSLWLSASVLSSPHKSSSSHGGYHAISELDKPPSIAKEPLSSYWAYYSPYHPAGKFHGSTPKGCVVSQVNIVNFFSITFPTPP